MLTIVLELSQLESKLKTAQDAFQPINAELKALVQEEEQLRVKRRKIETKFGPLRGQVTQLQQQIVYTTQKRDRFIKIVSTKQNVSPGSAKRNLFSGQQEAAQSAKEQKIDVVQEFNDAADDDFAQLDVLEACEKAESNI